MKVTEMTHKELVANCEVTAKLLKALAHPQRLQILCHLSVSEMTVGALEKLCGSSQSTVSQFLARMKAEGLVQSRKEGQFVYYSIADLKVLKLIQSLHKIFCP